MKKELLVEGMSCEHCANRVKQGLEELEGVKKAKVNLKKGQVKLVLTNELISDEEIEKKIEETGYLVKKQVGLIGSK